MKKALEIVIPKKAYVMEDAKNLLLKIFIDREKELDKTISILTYQVSKIVEEALFPTDFQKLLYKYYLF